MIIQKAKMIEDKEVFAKFDGQTFDHLLPEKCRDCKVTHITCFECVTKEKENGIDA